MRAGWASIALLAWVGTGCFGSNGDDLFASGNLGLGGNRGPQGGAMGGASALGGGGASGGPTGSGGTASGIGGSGTAVGGNPGTGGVIANNDASLDGNIGANDDDASRARDGSSVSDGSRGAEGAATGAGAGGGGEESDGGRSDALADARLVDVTDAFVPLDAGATDARADTNIADVIVVGDGAPTVCSRQSIVPARLQIVNNFRNRALAIIFVNNNCREIAAPPDLQAGNTRNLNTFVGFVWRIRDANTGEVLLDVPPLTPGNTTVTLP